VKGHHGRRSRSDHVQRIAGLIRAEVWELEACTVYAGYPGVRTALAHCQREVYPLGVALKQLFDRAIADLIDVEETVQSPQVMRMATFLQLWYREHESVAQIAPLSS
jgi:hypothetical protein